ncbi:MAG: Ppx/GppA family phosphatase, partial [Acidobacteriota bacterium]
MAESAELPGETPPADPPSSPTLPKAPSPIGVAGSSETAMTAPGGPGSSPGQGGRRPKILAAVDLGSNSFRMVIARVVGGELQMIDRLRDGVRLGGHLDKQQNITLDGQVRAIQCLQKFGQRLGDFPPGTVRAVGTNTLRRGRNAPAFLKEAEKALGHPIEVVSGQEEARLIFLGVAHSVAGGPSRRLVVDIGGGSTECIIGDGAEPFETESLYMGCVSFTLAHFRGGRITAKRFRKAETAARLELRAIACDYRNRGWDRAVGASGTILAVAEILRSQGWSGGPISSEGLHRLHDEMVEKGHV